METHSSTSPTAVISANKRSADHAELTTKATGRKKIRKTSHKVRKTIKKGSALSTDKHQTMMASPLKPMISIAK
jgi:hypothetical protein